MQIQRFVKSEIIIIFFKTHFVEHDFDFNLN